MADSPEFTPGRRIKNGVIWHDSPSWTGPSSSQKIYSQRVPGRFPYIPFNYSELFPVKPTSVNNQKKSGENENYFEPPVDDEMFEDDEVCFCSVSILIFELRSTIPLTVC